MYFSCIYTNMNETSARRFNEKSLENASAYLRVSSFDLSNGTIIKLRDEAWISLRGRRNKSAENGEAKTAGARKKETA